MDTIKTILFTILLSVVTCFWVLFSADGFTNYIGGFNLLYVVSYIMTFFLFWGMWILIGTRYLK